MRLPHEETTAGRCSKTDAIEHEGHHWRMVYKMGGIVRLSRVDEEGRKWTRALIASTPVRRLTSGRAV